MEPPRPPEWAHLLLVLAVLLAPPQLLRPSRQFQVLGDVAAAQLDKEKTANLNLSMPNYDLYHRSDVFQKKVKALVDRHPLIMSMEVLQAVGMKGAGDAGYSTEMMVVTVEAGGLGSKKGQNLRLLLDFGEHGRELVTSEVALRLLQTLAGEHPLNHADRDTLHQILPRATIKIVPMENSNGRRRVEAGNLCERKNGRGVDPNRNWGVDWGKKEKDYDPSEEYPGIAAFSEPETQILRDLAKSFEPHVWVNVHSGMEALFMPYDHKGNVPADGEVQMRTLLQTLNRHHCDDNCVVGSGGGTVGYLAHGTATDYMYDILKVPMAFTWEIYGDSTQPESDCFQMFNPATASKLEKVISAWSSSFFTLLVNLPKSLHSLNNRSTMLEGWDFGPLSMSPTSEIPDLQLRNQFSMSADPLIWAESLHPETPRKWEIEEVLNESRFAKEEGQLFLEISLAGILFWILFRRWRYFLGTLNIIWCEPLLNRGRRVPV